MKAIKWMVEVMLNTTTEWKPKKVNRYKRRVNHGV
jgi:hypothetical protein